MGPGRRRISGYVQRFEEADRRREVLEAQGDFVSSCSAQVFEDTRAWSRCGLDLGAALRDDLGPDFEARLFALPDQRVVRDRRVEVEEDEDDADADDSTDGEGGDGESGSNDADESETNDDAGELSERDAG